MLGLPILAHGALGAFDELLFSGVGVVFIVMMAVSWIRSRNAPLEIDDETAASPEMQNPADETDHIPLK